MKTVAAVLLLGVFIANDTANWIAQATGYSPAAVFYMLQGAWVAVLSGCVLVFMLAAKPSLSRSLGIAAAGISMFEGAMIPAFRIAVSDISAVPRGTNLGDHVTGLPISAVTLTLELMILAWIVGSSLRKRDE